MPAEQNVETTLKADYYLLGCYFPSEKMNLRK